MNKDKIDEIKKFLEDKALYIKDWCLKFYKDHEEEVKITAVSFLTMIIGYFKGKSDGLDKMEHIMTVRRREESRC